MGTPDTVRTKCPKCSEMLNFQSKGGNCTLTTYTLEDAPDDVMTDVNRHAPLRCACGRHWVVVVSGMRGRFLVEVVK